LNRKKFMILFFAVILIAGGFLPAQMNRGVAEQARDNKNKNPHIYYAAGVIKSPILTSDKLSSEQWALYNDGNFQIKEEQNKFPVYEKPFDQPMNPGKWQKKIKKHSQNPNVNLIRNPKHSFAGIDINISEAWALYEIQRNVIVAMVDTGIDYNHEDLSDVMWINGDEIPGNDIDDDGNGYTDDVYGWNFYDNTNEVCVGEEDDHGTHGAGTIAATKNNSVGIAGIADYDSINIMSLKALGGKDGSGTTDSIIKSIKYAENNGASICNLSLGTTSYDQELYDTIADSSMLFIVAAGNGDSERGANIDSAPLYPASFDLDNIITVANISYDGNLSENSNYGETSVDIAAPGSYILGLTANNGYAYMSGTSMAAPMVTGTAALLYTADSELSLADIKNVILWTAASLDSLSGKVSSGGMLNAGAALQYIKHAE